MKLAEELNREINLKLTEKIHVELIFRKKETLTVVFFWENYRYF